MFCGKCGGQVNPEGKFCGSCGTPVKQSETSAAPPPPLVPPVATPVTPPVDAPVVPPVVPPVAAPVTPPVVVPVAPVQYQSEDNPYKIVAVTLAACLVLLIAGGGYYFLGGSGESDSGSSEALVVAPVAAPETSSEEAVDSGSAESSSQSVSVPEVVEPEVIVVEPEVSDEVEYVLPNSRYEELTNGDLYGFDSVMLRIARNEIYARHGRMFADEELQAYFDSKEWYRNIYPKYPATDFEKLNPSPLSSVELKNLQTISEYEKNMAG